MNQQFLFDVAGVWQCNNNASAFYSNDTIGIIKVSLNNKMGGSPQEWAPEHLFLSSIGSSFMTTFMFICQQVECSIKHLECNIAGKVKEIDGVGYQFTQVDIYTKIELEEEALKSKVNNFLEEAKKKCLVAHSVTANVIYHSETIII